MDLRQLDVLLAVAEHQSFSAAARALHTVQSKVSAHIAQLERETGAVLIDRARRCLTPEGQVVADRARRIQLELRAISEDLGAMQANLSGTVTAGVIGTTARWLVPRLLDETSRQHPLLEVIVLDATTTSLVPLLIENRLELAVVNLPVDDPDIETEDLFSEDRVVIAPAGHELADRDRIDLVDLARHEVLLPPRGTAFRDEVDADARRVRVELRCRAEIDGLRLLASLAFSGFAPALLPASAAHGVVQGGWRSVKVDRLSARTVGLARNRRTVPAAPPRAVGETIRWIVQQEAAAQPYIHAVDTRPAP
ncbi:MAG: LysR family transcriptional regulator [Acidimicrobiaceae bacterium]|nr:LysR family transcriptional regulator [Acidimicrobiaceae bacterium]MYE98323.1 LysR family transcriptional regulator [Acidimicrobiaceae bacterium]MYI54629.1 LysR family transcriptional regulator [Acidimicrobiaceae bacterium]